MESTIKEQLEKEFLELYPTENERLQSKTVAVREMFDDIETARKRGVKLKAIVEVFQKKGINMSYDELRQLLHRVRKERKTCS